MLPDVAHAFLKLVKGFMYHRLVHYTRLRPKVSHIDHTAATKSQRRDEQLRNLALRYACNDLLVSTAEMLQRGVALSCGLQGVGANNETSSSLADCWSEAKMSLVVAFSIVLDASIACAHHDHWSSFRLGEAVYATSSFHVGRFSPKTN